MSAICHGEDGGVFCEHAFKLVMRRRISIVLLALLLLSVSPVSFAADIPVATDASNFVFADREDGNLILESYTGSNIADIVIPETVDGKRVAEIAQDAFRIPAYPSWDDPRRSQIRSIFIPDSVELIGDAAFAHNLGLESVRLPADLTAIPERTFQTCERLSTITWPVQLTSIGRYAFEGCIGLEDLRIPDTVSELGVGCFARCEGLLSVQLPAALSVVPRAAFFQCGSFPTIRIPDRVRTIEETAFARCTSLETIGLPVSVTDIGEYAFEYCYALKDIYYGGTEETFATIHVAQDAIPDMGIFMHYDCTEGTELVPSVQNVENGFIYAEEEDGVIVLGATDHSAATVSIPNRIAGRPVVAVGAAAFREDTALQSIRLPGTVRRIASDAFRDCERLTDIVFPSALESIGACAFLNCTMLPQIVLPASVHTVGDRAFGNCERVQVIELPDGLTTISSYTFGGCASVPSAILPNGLTTIENGAFAGCISLRWIGVPTSLTSIDEDAFAACDELKDVYYAGTQEQYRRISLSKNTLQGMQVHYGTARPIFALPEGVVLMTNSPLYVDTGTGYLCGYTLSANGLSAQTLIYQFSLSQDMTLEILNKEGQSVPASDRVATGDTLRIRKGDDTAYAATVVVGADVVGNGIMGVTQVVRMASAYRKKIQLVGPYLAAGDFDSDGVINLSDLVEEARILRLVVVQGV